MDRPHVRPRVALRFPHDVDALRTTLEARLAANPRLEGRIRRQAVLVWIAPDRRRWWSPCLELSVTAEGEGTRLVGYYTAHPQLMTAMAFGAIGLSFLAGVSGTWALVQYQMGEPPYCAVGTTLGLGALAAIFAANRVAQRWAADEMHEIAVLLDGLGAVDVDEAHAFG